MPKIPRAEGSSTSIKPVAPSRQSTAGLIDKSDEIVGNALMQVGEHIQYVNDITQAAKAQQQVAEAYSKIQQAAKEDPNSLTPDEYFKQIEEVKSNVNAPISDPRIKVGLESSLNNQAASASVSVNNSIRNNRIDQAKATRLERQVTRENQFYEAETLTQKQLVLDAMEIDEDAWASAGIITHEQAAIAKEQHRRNMVVGEIAHDITNDPRLVKARLEAGYYDAITPLTREEKDNAISDADKAIASNDVKAERTNKKLIGQTESAVAVSMADGEQSLAELNQLVLMGAITRPFYDASRKALLATPDDPKISPAEKAAFETEMIDEFSRLAGVQLDNLGSPILGPEGNDLDVLNAIRLKAIDGREKLSAGTYKLIINATQNDLLRAESELDMPVMPQETKQKFGFLEKIRKGINVALDPLGDYRTVAFNYLKEAFKKDVTPEQANDIATKLIAGEVARVNPNKTAYKVGQILTNPNGLQAEVVDFDAKGNPILKWKK